MAGITFLFTGQKYLAIFGALYLGLVCLLAIPFFQGHALYLNSVRIPLFSDYATPEKYGLAPNRTLNLKIRTSDNETLGAWFVLSDPYYRSLSTIPSDVSKHVKFALAAGPVVLFFHGNAATRAFSARVRHYQAFGSRLGASVLAIDYRGFADSTGTPSEAGLTRDAKAAFNWLVEHGKKPEEILIAGHSLGSGVSGQLGAELSRDGITPKGIVLLSPFSSIREVLETYQMFGFIPLIKPLSVIPGALRLVQRLLIHRFDTLQAVPNITAPVLIAHAENDWDIPHSHSDVLFEAFLDPLLPPVDLALEPFSMSESLWLKITEQQAARKAKRGEIVSTQTLPKFGTLQSFSDKGRKVVLVKTLAGAHDYLGVQEGLVDIIGKTFGILV
ncbi:unnamed protein product [Cyclocybe aegerita]|uniref:AB hydrolase-1 domain-containing protein n=1 Tax=Cyclocybe aegerita TaxID=1973307 RepID=A0A8S0W8K9_CYCAE|nr:unnamed protein product [Cyclocybe aegerita]